MATSTYVGTSTVRFTDGQLADVGFDFKGYDTPDALNVKSETERWLDDMGERIGGYADSVGNWLGAARDSVMNQVDRLRGNAAGILDRKLRAAGAPELSAGAVGAVPVTSIQAGLARGAYNTAAGKFEAVDRDRALQAVDAGRLALASYRSQIPDAAGLSIMEGSREELLELEVGLLQGALVESAAARANTGRAAVLDDSRSAELEYYIWNEL